MPIKQCIRKGKPGFQWGNNGKCYTYTLGDKQEKKQAKKKANQQMQAAYASGYGGYT